jgi:hypothetical protein
MTTNGLNKYAENDIRLNGRSSFEFKIPTMNPTSENMIKFYKLFVNLE